MRYNIGYMADKENPKGQEPSEPKDPKDEGETPIVFKTGVESMLGPGIVEREGDEITFTPYGPAIALPVPSHKLNKEGRVIGPLTGLPGIPFLDPNDIPPLPGEQTPPAPRPTATTRRSFFARPPGATSTWPGEPKNPDGTPRINPSLPQEPPKKDNGNGGPNGGK